MYEAVKTLDQAAERLNRAARDQLELSLQTSSLIADSLDGKADEDPNSMRRRLDMRRGLPALQARGPRLADDEGDFVKEFQHVWKQAVMMKALLPPDQAERLERAKSLGVSRRVVSFLASAGDDLRQQGNLEDRREAWLKALVKQWSTANAILEIAASNCSRR